MPFSIEWTEDGQSLTWSGSGVVTAREILRAKERCLAQPERVRAVLRTTIILADITELEVTAIDLRRIASLDLQLSALNPHAAVAIVAPQDLMFGVARMWENYVEGAGWRTGVFRTFPEAEAWLTATVSARS